MKKAAVLTAALLLVCAVLGAQERVRDQKDKTQYETVFDLLRDLGVVPDTELYLMAERMDMMEKGILKWRNFLRGVKP